MFTDLHEEIAAIFSGYEGCLGYTDKNSLTFNLTRQARYELQKQEDPDFGKKSWQKRKAALAQDAELRERKRQSSERWRDNNKELIAERRKGYKTPSQKEQWQKIKAHLEANPDAAQARKEYRRAWIAKKRAQDPAVREADAARQKKWRDKARQERLAAKLLDGQSAHDGAEMNGPSERTGEPNAG